MIRFIIIIAILYLSLCGIQKIPEGRLITGLIALSVFCGGGCLMGIMIHPLRKILKICPDSPLDNFIGAICMLLLFLSFVAVIYLRENKKSSHKNHLKTINFAKELKNE